MFAPQEHVNRAEAAVMIYQANEVSPITINPEFQVKKTIEQDGIEFNVKSDIRKAICKGKSH